jgi:hypothetical protein
MAEARRSQIIRNCVRLADDLSDQNGFLPVRSLAEHFSIGVIFRPLLVEAMLASVPASDKVGPQWLVLVDTDRFATGQVEYEKESAERTLPSRLRNTIAHEILHSLSFRATESDFQFRMAKRSGENHESFVKRIERETEDLSPLLLIPEKRLLRLAHGSKIELQDILDLQHQCAATRDVLVNRFRIWKRDDVNGNLFGGAVENIGLGIGFWQAGNAFLSGFPVFVNFRNNYLPHLFTQLLSKKQIEVKEITADPDFILNGGRSACVEMSGHRQEEVLDYLKMQIRLSVEPGAASRRGRFLFLVEKIS